MKRKYKILIVSSSPKSYSGNLCEDVVDAYRAAGHDVTFNFPGFDELFARKRGSSNPIRRILDKIRTRLRLPVFQPNNIFDRKGYFFPCGDEKRSAYSPSRFVAKCQGQYDVVICYFFLGFINITTLALLHKKFNCPIIIASIDMYQMTGGCYYFGECRGFRDECRNCPATEGLRTDMPHTNFLLKKKLYAECDMYFLCNTWSRGFCMESPIISHDRLLPVTFTLNEEFYAPMNHVACREQLGVPAGKTRIFAMRWQDISRKGCHYAVDALNALYGSLAKEDRERLLLMTIGGKMKDKPLFDVLELGLVRPTMMVKFYNAASAFLCPSTDDAGPSMVNQSLACGTPVVAFDSGTAMDVVLTGETGYRAEYKNGQDFYEGVRYVFNCSDAELDRMRKRSRDIALKYNSRAAGAKMLEDWMEKIEGQKRCKQDSNL